MPDPFDAYVDQFTLAVGPYGVTLNFSRSGPKPGAPGSIPQAEDVGAIRMGLEHFKLMAFLMKRQVTEIEDKLGIEIPIPVQIMSQLGIAPEDWHQFWKREK